MSMPKPKLTLYVDIISPFAYLAYHVIRTSPVFKNCEVTYVPVFLGGIMKHCGNTPPLFIKNKGKWIDVERLRWARRFDIPMADTIPDGFPMSTLATQRALTALSLQAPDKFLDVLAALFHAFHVERKQIAKPDEFMPIFESIIGNEAAAEILAKSTSDTVKALLSANTDKAIQEGAFGLPWFVATNSEGVKECYWGFDHIAQVADHLGLDRPKPTSAKEGGWRALL